VLDSLTHGWMHVSISDGSKIVDLVISDVPCNSIYKLADILLNLQSGLLNEEVDFSLEPEYALWKFIVSGDDLKIEVFPDSKCETPIVFIGRKEKTINRLYKGLRDLESNPVWKNTELSNSVWSWDFPSRELNMFKANRKVA